MSPGRGARYTWRWVWMVPEGASGACQAHPLPRRRTFTHTHVGTTWQGGPGPEARLWKLPAPCRQDQDVCCGPENSELRSHWSLALRGGAAGGLGQGLTPLEFRLPSPGDLKPPAGQKGSAGDRCASTGDGCQHTLFRRSAISQVFLGVFRVSPGKIHGSGPQPSPSPVRSARVSSLCDGHGPGCSGRRAPRGPTLQQGGLEPEGPGPNSTPPYSCCHPGQAPASVSSSINQGLG